MLHRSAVDDEARQFQSRPFMDHPNRPSSRTSRPGSRNRMVKPSAAVTPTGLGVVTEHTPAPPPETLQSATSPIREGLGSLNRWSQSTTSSRSVSEYTGHHRGNSKASISNYSPQRGTTLAELPELNLPELRASQMFSSDLNPHLDLSFTASSQIFQNSTVDDSQYEQPQGSYQLNNARASEMSMDDDADGRQTQKAMLSKALQKANTAVLLDNAANFEGAMEAYTEACQLLQLVMLRSNGGDEERLKLQEIRDTYMIRITELQRMDLPLPVHDNKALPQRPVSEASFDDIFHASSTDGPRIQSQHSSAHSSFGYQNPIDEPKSLPAESIPPRRQSLRPTTLEEFRNIGLPKTTQPGSTPASIGTNPQYSGQYFESAGENVDQSWLDTIDESGASSPSSANSKASSVYLRRRTSRRMSTGTEAEFDAALDAAVEAAYDEGLEPVLEYNEDASDDVVANARRNIELAKQRVREAEREAQEAMTRGRNLQEPVVEPVERDSVYLDEEAEEEERLLEEMTKGYIMDDFEFGIQSKSALPRESDSSNMSGRTWESSAASNITGTGATLSTLTEDDDVLLGAHTLDRNTLPSAPPNAALPPIPAVSDFPALPPHRISLSNPPPPGPPPPPPSMGPPPVPGVRARRLSKNNSVDLRIHTKSHSRAESNLSHARAESTVSNTRAESRISHARAESNASGLGSFSIPGTDKPPPPPKDDNSDVSRPSTPGLRGNLHPSKRNASINSLSEHINLARARTQEDEEPSLPPLPASARPMAKIPSAPDGLNKAGSKPFRSRNGSMPNPDIGPGSPITPWEDSFPPLDTQLAMPIMPTPNNTPFSPISLPTSGMNLFDCEIHSSTPGRPNSLLPNAPAPLEACPESFLLRPFWLMRSLYQTIAHPHGGYITAKLFVPRDIWRVKNVKIKAVEDKVSQCDLLTAALLKLAKVDPYDADAVLEEMEGLETVLNQVQTVLTKKLGNEVGVQTAVPLFKPNGAPEDSAHPEPAQPRTSGTSNKSYIPGWKRLRAKTSGIGTTTAAAPTPRESHKENLTLNTVPMTMAPSTHPSRNVTKLEFSGPHAHYMGALARLFDAAQVIDQIAQQVEDPGLKHSSKTHVGLELSTRHAAEFFGFYICRFALGDINLMLDKFIKRGSEWVLI